MRTTSAVEEVVRPDLGKRASLFLPKGVRTLDRMLVKRMSNSSRKLSKKETLLSSKRLRYPDMESRSDVKTIVGPDSLHLRRRKMSRLVNFMSRTTSSRRFCLHHCNSCPNIDILVRGRLLYIAQNWKEVPWVFSTNLLITPFARFVWYNVTWSYL